ncbi:MAG TPA: NAD-binding protein [Campylobacterales bacterium]|nr:NAD-binding protein [Campylobacterales bacterium]
MRENEAFWIVIRRLRTPILALIVTYTISIILLTLVEGRDNNGNVHHLSFFDAFYIVSYTANTIGFGEIPYPLTYPQRLMLTITIYMTVPAWFYALGTIVGLFRDKAFKRELKRIIFRRQIEHFTDDFVVICGYNSTSRIMIDKFQKYGKYRMVVLDKLEEKIDELTLEGYYPIVPALAADATTTDVLEDAGIASPHCKALFVLFEDDDLNLKVAVKAKILNKNIEIVAESSFTAGLHNLTDVGVEHVIDPYHHVATRIEYMLNTPHLYALLNWLGGGNLNLSRKAKLTRGKYIICSRGRLGKAIKEILLKNGIEYEIVDIFKETKAKDGSDRDLLLKAGIETAGCLIAGTPDDAVNLSAIITARKLNPGIFVMVRENKMEENSVFAALRANTVFVMDKIVAVRAYNIIARPLVIRFADELIHKSDEWGRNIVEKLTEIINKKPQLKEILIDENEAYALMPILKERAVAYKDLVADVDGEGRELELIILAVLRRNGEFIMGPSFGSAFEAGDKLLIAGTDDAIWEFEEILNNINKLYFVLNKKEMANWLFEKAARFIQNKVKSRQN